MGTVLHIGKNKEIAFNNEVIEKGDSVLGYFNPLNNCMAKYMPDYLFSSEEADESREIPGFLLQKLNLKPIITDNKKLTPRVKKFNEFLPVNQRKAAILRESRIYALFPEYELKDIEELVLYARITDKDRTLVKIDSRTKGIIDFQNDPDCLLNKIC